MDLSEWEEHFGSLLEDEVDTYLDENADELFQDDPMKPKGVQKKQTKEELMRMFRLEDATESIDRALCIVRDMLPQRVSKDVWESCLNEFLTCDESLCEFFEKDADGEISHDDYIPIHQMLGLSTETLRHCYELGQWCYAEKDFDDGRCLFGFLTSVAPYMPEFWVSLGMSYNQMGQYQEAIDTYKTAQELFVGDPSMHIHCANNYIAIGDNTCANIQLDEVNKIFDEHPEHKSDWEKTYDYIRSRSDSNYKKI
jgi:tetratricopeptide (TPR) repeat protein